MTKIMNLFSITNRMMRMITFRMQIFGKTNYFAVLKASGSLSTDLRKHYLAL